MTRTQVHKSKLRFYCIKFSSAASKFNIITLRHVSLIVQINHFMQLPDSVFLWLEGTLGLYPNLGIWELKCGSNEQSLLCILPELLPYWQLHFSNYLHLKLVTSKKCGSFVANFPYEPAFQICWQCCALCKTQGLRQNILKSFEALNANFTQLHCCDSIHPGDQMPGCSAFFKS